MGCFLLKWIWACFILALITVSGKSLTPSCYGDVCGINNEHQFCSDKFQYCRNCEDVMDDCGTANQPTACNRYCIDIAVAKALNDKGSACSLVPIMLKIDNGVVAENSKHISFVGVLANLTYTCNEGYDLQGPNNIICTENGTWSHSSIPYCRDNTCAADESKTSTLYLPIITAGICFLALGLVCLCCSLRKRKASMKRQYSENSLRLEKLHLISDKQNEPDEDTIPTSNPADKRFDVDDTEKQALSPSSSTPPSESDIKGENITDGNDKTDCSDPEHKVPGSLTVVFKNYNILQPPAATLQMQPETEEQCPRQKIDPLNATSMKRENKDENLPTEESGETEACVNRASGKNDSGTEPLPSRNEELKPFQETLKEKKNKGPEAIPAEDDKIKLSTDETRQGQTTNKVGIQDVTFAKSDISDKHRNPLGQEVIDLAKNEQVASSQEMFEMKGVDDTEIISEDHSAQDLNHVLT